MEKHSAATMSVPLLSSNQAGPPAPSNPRIDKRSKTSIALAWDRADDFYIKFYKIYRILANAAALKPATTLYPATDLYPSFDGGNTLANFAKIASTKKLFYQDNFLTTGTDYVYKISALDDFDLESDPTDGVSSEITAPATIANLTIIRAAGRAITITWNASTNKYLKKYRIYRSDDNITYSPIGDTEETHFTDSNLSTGSTWYYKIAAINKFDTASTLSSSVSHTITDLSPFKDTFSVPTAGITVVKDIETALGRKGIEGTIICLGPGKIQVEFSYDGTNYDTPMWLRKEDYYNISSKQDYMEVSKIRFNTDVNTTQITLSIV